MTIARAVATASASNEPTTNKVQFFKTVKDIERRLGNKSVALNSFVISPTRMGDLQKWGITTLDGFRALNVLLMKDDTGYGKRLLDGVGLAA